MTSGSSFVFAYGSNMHTADLCRWMSDHGHDASALGVARPAVLDDYALVWNYRSGARKGGAANVQPESGACVHGVALAVSPSGLSALDEKEGHPHRYDRGERPRTVRLAAGGHVDAWVYVVTPAWVQDHRVPPNRAYVDLMIEGARQHALPERWIAHLRTIDVMR